MNKLLPSIMVCFVLCTACKVHILDAEIVSMMTDELPKDPKKGRAVEEEWCIKDAPKDEDLLAGPGYLDRVTLKAHKKHNAKYFADVSYYQAGTCAVMRGRVVK
jgi:hypothetical protein